MNHMQRMVQVNNAAVHVAKLIAGLPSHVRGLVLDSTCELIRQMADATHVEDTATWTLTERQTLPPANATPNGVPDIWTAKVRDIKTLSKADAKVRRRMVKTLRRLFIERDTLTRAELLTAGGSEPGHVVVAAVAYLLRQGTVVRDGDGFRYVFRPPVKGLHRRVFDLAVESVTLNAHDVVAALHTGYDESRKALSTMCSVGLFTSHDGNYTIRPCVRAAELAKAADK